MNQLNDLKRCCADCRTTKTPLWRGGPAGPKVSVYHIFVVFGDMGFLLFGSFSLFVFLICAYVLQSLCNACGIRYRKKRRAMLGLNNREEKEKKERGKHKLGVSFKLRLLSLGRDVSLESCLLQKDRKLAEEEEAAVLLMALSCGFAST